MNIRLLSKSVQEAPARLRSSTEGVRPLLPTEAAVATHTLALAFDGDPMFRFLLPGAKARVAWLHWFFAGVLGESLACGGAWTLEKGPAHGAMGLIPPGCWPIPFSTTLRAIPFPARLPTFRFVTSGLTAMREMMRLHPRAPHLYLYAVGVDPARQGDGLGGAMLRKACAMADEARLSSYLETANPANIGFYERYGYRVRETVTLRRGPPLWTMERPAAVNLRA